MKKSKPPSKTPDATRAPLPCVQIKRAKGHEYHYFRTRTGGRETRIPLRGTPWSADYLAHYAELKETSNGAPKQSRKPPGSLGAMIEAFRRSPEFTQLAPKTQRDYSKALERLEILLDFPAAAIKRSDIVKLRNKAQIASGARAADLFISVASRAFGIGLDLGFVDLNPAREIKRIAQSESYQPWPVEARAAFETSNPPLHLMTAYRIGLWTALRIGDVVRLGRQHDDGAGFTLRPSKTRKSSGVEIYIPAYSELRTHIETLPAGHLLFVTRGDGTPLRADTLSKEFRAWLKTIGIDGLHFHGLRHTTGTALAERGASAHEIMAILGHTTLQMAERYTKRAQQRQLAKSGMQKLEDARTRTEREGGKP